MTARAAKDEAMSQVKRHANPVWISYMVDLVWDICQIQEIFTSDDVYDRYTAIEDPMKPTTHEPRAMGPVMQQAAREGWCIQADTRARPSRRKSLHASPRTVWRSRIFKS